MFIFPNIQLFRVLIVVGRPAKFQSDIIFFHLEVMMFSHNEHKHFPKNTNSKPRVRKKFHRTKL